MKFYTLINQRRALEHKDLLKSLLEFNFKNSEKSAPQSHPLEVFLGRQNYKNHFSILWKNLRISHPFNEFVGIHLTANV